MTITIAGRESLSEHFKDHYTEDCPIVSIPFALLEQLSANHGLADKKQPAKWYIQVTDEKGNGIVGCGYKTAPEDGLSNILYEAADAVGLVPHTYPDLFTKEERAAFKQTVLTHLAAAISPEEWATWRQEKAADKSRWCGRPSEEDYTPNAKPEEFIEQATAEVNIGPESLFTMEEPQTIGEIAGREVLYLKENGIYAWPHQEGRHMLMLWLSDPAYPPGW